MNENKVKAMEVVGDSAGVLSEANKTKIVAAWAASGMTAPGFAPQAGVPAHRLYEWRRAARQRQNETTRRRLVRGGAPRGGDEQRLGGGGVDALRSGAIFPDRLARVGGSAHPGAEPMLSIAATTKVYLRPGATDLRLGYEGLTQLVRNTLRQEPQSGHVFAFCNQSRTRLKLLLHDGSGLWLCSKRLDAGAFTWPLDGPADALTAAQLWALLAGLEVSGWKKHWRR